MITLYNILEGFNTINKTLSNGTQINGYINEDQLDVLRPYITIKSSELGNANYCYISELGRYYFIDSTETLDNTHIILHLSIDVLMTYSSAILASNATCIKRTNGNQYYPNFDTECRKQRTIYSFSNTGFNTNGTFVLATITNNQ